MNKEKRFSPFELHLQWNDWTAEGRHAAITGSAIFGDPMGRHAAVYSMADYIVWLREELAHRNYLQGQTREFLGIDRREALI